MVPLLLLLLLLSAPSYTSPQSQPRYHSSKELDDFLLLTNRIERIKAMGAGFVSCPPSSSAAAQGQGQDGGEEWDMVAEEA